MCWHVTKIGVHFQSKLSQLLSRLKAISVRAHPSKHFRLFYDLYHLTGHKWRVVYNKCLSHITWTVKEKYCIFWLCENVLIGELSVSLVYPVSKPVLLPFSNASPLF